jgi:hypothetical protein
VIAPEGERRGEREGKEGLRGTRRRSAAQKRQRGERLGCFKLNSIRAERESGW